MVEVEGENSAMNAVCAAAIAGGRTFTATPSYGLVFMYDAMLIAAISRSRVRALAPEVGLMPMLSFIDGLANIDITVPNIDRMINDTYSAAQDKPYQKVTWISLE